MAIPERLMPVIVSAGLLGILAAPAFAQRVAFHPEVQATQGYTENPLYLELGSVEGERNSDWTTSVSVMLPLRWVWPKGRADLSYNPAFERYREATDLDHDEHRLHFGTALDLSRRTSMNWSVGFDRTQQLGEVSSTDSSDFYLAPRSDRDRFSTNLALSGRAATRWRWDTRLRAGSQRYRILSDFDPAFAAILEDRDNYGGSLQLLRSVSRVLQIGGSYGYEKFDLSESSDENVHEVRVQFDLEAGPATSVQFGVGTFRRSRDAVVGIGEEGGHQSGLSLDAEMKRRFGNSVMRIMASRSPTPGGALRGTSTDTVAGLVFVAEPSSQWTWDLALRHARRASTIPDVEDVRNSAGSVNVEWRPRERFGVRCSAEYLNQAGSELPELNGSFAVARIGVVWYPLGRRSESPRELP